MKKKFDFSSYDEVSRDEMRDMVTGSNRGDTGLKSGWESGSGSGSNSGSGSGSDSGSGSGSHLNAQIQACRTGQTEGAPCEWTWGGLRRTGVCFRDPVVGLLCANFDHIVSGSGSGLGDLSAREAACLGKSMGSKCWFTGTSGATLEGICCINNNHVSGRPLFCTQSVGICPNK